MPFARPFQRPHIWQSRIVSAADGLYRGAEDAVEPASWADCAMVYDERSEAWGTVAWVHDWPDEWWLGRYPFYPEKGWPPIMGAAEFMFAADVGADLYLTATPESYVTRAWCRWDGPCGCVLNWERPDAVRLWLSIVRAVHCETAALARAIENVLRAEPARRRLRITIAEPAEPAPSSEGPSVRLEPGTVLEPFPLPDRDEAHASANDAEAKP